MEHFANAGSDRRGFMAHGLSDDVVYHLVWILGAACDIGVLQQELVVFFFDDPLADLHEALGTVGGFGLDGGVSASGEK